MAGLKQSRVRFSCRSPRVGRKATLQAWTGNAYLGVSELGGSVCFRRSSRPDLLYMSIPGFEQPTLLGMTAPFDPLLQCPSGDTILPSRVAIGASLAPPAGQHLSLILCSRATVRPNSSRPGLQPGRRIFFRLLSQHEHSIVRRRPHSLGVEEVTPWNG